MNIALAGKRTQTKKPSIPPIQEMRSKEEVLNYSFPPLVERLQEEHDLSEKHAKLLFQDLIMFLYLCGTNTTSKKYSPPKMIDEAWHTFIVFTREYNKFCHDNFGYFIHHEPFTKGNRAEEARKSVLATPYARKAFGKLSKNWVSGSKCNSTCRGGCNGQNCRDN